MGSRKVGIPLERFRVIPTRPREPLSVLVDPTSIDALAQAMYRVWTDRDLRQALVRKGVERAKRFSWEQTPRRYVELYQEVCTLR